MTKSRIPAALTALLIALPSAAAAATYDITLTNVPVVRINNQPLALYCQSPADATLAAEASGVQNGEIWTSKSIETPAGAWVEWKLKAAGWTSSTANVTLHITTTAPDPAGAVFVAAFGGEPGPSGSDRGYRCVPTQSPPPGPINFYYTLPEQADVRIEVFHGTRTTRSVLVHESVHLSVPAGPQSERWSLLDDDTSKPVAPGLYIAKCTCTTPFGSPTPYLVAVYEFRASALLPGGRMRK